MVFYDDDMDYEEEEPCSETSILGANNEDYTVGLNINVREPTPEDSTAMILLGSKATSVKKDEDQKSGASVESLGDELTEKLLARLPQIQKSTSEEGDFFMREKTLKPPRSADVNEIPFPPEEKLEKPEQVRKEEEALLGSSLAVVRYLPEGPVDRSVPHISITFSQPMVAVSGVEDVHDQDFSFVKIEPFPKNGGRFRWMGAKTLFFEPNYRFDMSTEYTVTIDCEKTKSSVGGVLDKNVSFKFETPRLTMLNYLPNSYHAVPINEFPFVYMEFDQDIDPNQIFSSVNIPGYSCKLVQNDGRTSVVKSYIEGKLKESSLEKRSSSLYNSVNYKLENSAPNRHVWIEIDVASRRVALSETLAITLLQGARSIEGPLRTEKDISFTATNYPEFKVTSHTGGKLPLEPFSFTFSNNIDIELLNEEHISIQPPIERLRINPSGNYLTISGNIKGRTTYQVQLSGQITDVWGQKLAGENNFTFQVGPAAQSLQAYKTGMMVIDPTVNTKPSFSVFSVNLEAIHVQVYQVKPGDYSNNVFYYDAYSNATLSLSGKKVLDTMVNTNGQPDEPVDTEIDLTQYLQHPNDMLGQLLVAVEPSKTHWKDNWKYRPVYISWIQVTKMAMDGFFDTRTGNVYCWANSLIDGTVIKSDVSFKQKKFLPSFSTKPDSETGIAVLSHTSNGSEYTLIGSYLNDTCFIPDLYLYHYRIDDRLAYNIFNDRGLYKPGEEIFIKGICRELKVEKYGSRTIPTLPKKGTYEYIVKDSRGAKYHTGKYTISEHGSFDIKFSIPDNVNLGSHSIEFNGRTMHTNFNVQEFRTPEFTVSTSVPPCRYIVNNLTILKTQAAYYSGGGLSGSKCSYVIKQSKTSYTPPNFSGFNFSTYISNPFYRYWCYDTYGSENYKPVTFEGVCNSDGEHEIAILFDETERQEKSPMNITVETSVQDINRQTINDSTTFTVHPCKYYCGMKIEKMFVKPNVQTNLFMVTTDLEGNTIPGIDMELVATTTVEKKKGFSVVHESVEVFKKVFKSESEPVKYPISFDKGGNYKFTLRIKDTETGLTNSSNNSLYVTGGKSKKDVVGSRLSKQQALLVADKGMYEIGEEAKILIQSPFDGKANGVVTVCLNSVIDNIPITIDPEVGSTEFTLKITKEHIPNVTVSVMLQGSESRSDSLGLPLDLPKQPAYANGTCYIGVSSKVHQLDVLVTPEKQFVTPGVETFVDVLVTDKENSKPQAGSEVCLVAVDEAVLSLTGYRISNPLSTFIVGTGQSFSEFSLRDHVFVKSFDNINIQSPPEDSSDEEECDDDECECCKCEGCLCRSCCCYDDCDCQEEVQERKSCKKSKKRCEEKECEECNDDAGGCEGGEEVGSAIVVRKNFNPVAVFSPVCVTDAQGKARVPFKLPDNLTRYRITAVSTKLDSLYGLGESSIVAQLPLAIRPSLPRFLNFGDKAEFACVLQNQTLIDLNVHIAVAYDGLELLDPSKRGLNVKIPALKRAELRFPMQATKVGISKFQVAVSVSELINFSDAVEKELRVFTPATTEAFAHYGELDGDCTTFQPVKAPENIYPQFGGLQITTSSTALSALTDAFLYVYNYSFECCEQLSSKILSIVALKDVLQAFKVKDIPSSIMLNSTVQLSLGILNGRQFPNGGFGWWTYRSDYSVSPYLSCHVGHAFARAKIAGYSLNNNVVSKLTNFLCDIENYIRDTYYSPSSKYAIRSYAYYVAALLGDSRAKQKADQLYSECGLKDTCLETLSWTASAMFFANGKEATTKSTEIVNYILMRVNETAQTANFVTSYGDEQSSKLIMLHSDRRTDGICLEMLIHMVPQNNLIPKVVKGLLAHKKKGRWGNTQENVFILLALNSYFHVFEGVTPDFTAKMWLGEDYCGEQVFKGRNKDENVLTIPMRQLTTTEGAQTLAILKEGPGRLYYRIGMDYAPKNLLLPALDYGFQIERSYEGVTDPSHAQFDKARNCWKFKAGELVRVIITFTNTSRRYHVALVDFLPAGLEPINPELKGNAPSGEVKKSRCWWNYPWYEHVNSRDERVEAFSSLLWEGTHTFKHLCRATQIGSFIIPPTKCEEMYSPEIFGRSNTIFAEVYE